MRRTLLALACLLVLTLGAPARAARTHVVAQGHTLGKIARRYNVSIDALCEANGISRRTRLKVGDRLVIPEGDDAEKAGKPHGEDPAEGEPDEPSDAADSPKEKAAKGDRGEAEDDAPGGSRGAGSDGLRVLDVPGHGEAYYYEPTGPGRKNMRPVLMYLHGRGGNPMRDCRRWAPVARRFGWLVCPSGPSAHGDGRDWNNNWYSGQQIALATLKALRREHGRRVQAFGNTLMGFSEGAYVALNVGVREPRTFNRWLILAGNTTYWGGAGLEELKKNASALKRVYLITGEADGVIEGTHQLREWLERYRVATRLSTPKDMGHEVALEKKGAMYRAALHWLDRGGGKPRKKAARGGRNAPARER